MVDLETIKSRNEFEDYYREKGLSTTGQRIEHLIEATGVRAIRGGASENEDVTLALLEESTALGYWRDLR